VVNQSQSGTRPGAVLAVLSLAAFVASLDLFIVNVAFDAIGRDFDGVSLSHLSWVLNGYAIVYAALLVPLGRLADRYGRKAGFLLGLGVFTLASAGCAATTDLGALVAFRVLQAAGAAALTPTSLGLLLPVFPPEGRARAVRIWAASGALAAAAGPVVGGLLVQLSWRWVFLVNLPVGVAALVAAWVLVPDSRDPQAGRLPDLLGTALAIVSIGSLSLGLVQGSDWGWTSARVLTAFGAAVVALAVLVRRTLHHPSPLVEPDLLAVRPFAWSNLAAIAFSAGFAANLLAMVLWMQQVWGWSALRTGLGVAPGPLMVPLFAVVAGVLGARGLAIGRVAALGCLLFAAGMVLTLTRLVPEPAYASHLLPGLLVGGAGVGLALPTILSSATAELPAARSATGSAVVTMSRQVGSVLGVAVLVAVLGTPTTYAQASDAFAAGWWACAAAALLGALAALGMTPRGDRGRTGPRGSGDRPGLTRPPRRAHPGQPPVDASGTRSRCGRVVTPSTRANGVGSVQFARPSTPTRAGASRPRTTSASMAMPRASAVASVLTSTLGTVESATNASTRMTAAEVTSRPVKAMPSTAAWSVRRCTSGSSLSSWTSRMRARMNTS
jgi:EmrB/QacA subfamily drug resistance transporter